MSHKPAPSSVEIHPLIQDRWSPLSFRPEPLTKLQIQQLCEAARWAPSSYNDQPWSFLMAPRDDEIEFSRLLSCLADANQVWAQHAGLLVLAIARTTLTRNGHPNRFGMHDTGMATIQLVLQAEAMGLKAHLMGGYNAAQARAIYEIPESFEPAAVMAIGFPGEVEKLPSELQQRERSERSRRSLDQMIFTGKFEQPFRF